MEGREPDRIDLWILTWRTPAPDHMLELSRAVLSSEELARSERYREPERREQAVLSRAVLRLALSGRFGKAPESWEFRVASRERPYLRTDGVVCDFNVSHTSECVVCAVSSGVRVGIDVEARSRAPEMREVASQFLSPAEEECLAALPARVADDRLVEIWTAKEALAKGVGAGLHLSLDRICFAGSLAAPGSGLRSTEARRWSFPALRDVDGRALALAVRAEPSSIAVDLRDGASLFRGC